MGIPVIYNDSLKKEYQQLFDTCVVHGSRIRLVDDLVKKIQRGQERYVALAKQVGCPWFLIGLIHYIECGLRWDRHLHNGDPLTARTVRVPKGRPVAGNAPFTFEESAIDALKGRGFHTWKDWKIPGICWQLERYNGFGYRQYHPEVKSPYLWSFTNHYKVGKYVLDGKFDSKAVSQQIGVMAIIKRAVELGVFQP